MDEGLLISLVESHQNLYDKKRKDFKDAITRENSWEEIANAMGESVDECQRVWRNLRDRFVKERKILTPSGAAAAAEPRWSLYKSLLFLEKHILPRKTTSNTRRPSRPGSAASGTTSSSQASPFDSLAVVFSPEAEAVGDEDVHPSTSKESTTDDVSIGIDTGEPSTPRDMATPSTSTGGKRTKRKLVEDRIASAMEGMVEQLKGAKPSTDTPFMLYLASRLEELPPHKAKMAKRHFLQYLDELEDSDI